MPKLGLHAYFACILSSRHQCFVDIRIFLSFCFAGDGGTLWTRSSSDSQRILRDTDAKLARAE